MDASVESFLALSTARLAPRTVEAYRRDLEDFCTWLDGPPDEITSDELAAYIASMRAAGLAGTTIARRVAALRSFYRHQVLLGARSDNPAAELELPRRRRTLPRTLSPGEAERLIEAASGTTPRSLRDRALVELLYGAGLRVSEAVGLERNGVDLEQRIVRCIGKGSKERVVPVGREAVQRCAVISTRTPVPRRPPPAGSNARRQLTRAGAFLILQTRRKSRGSSPAVHPHLLRHSFATHLLEGGAIPPVQGDASHADLATTDRWHARVSHPRESYVCAPSAG
jgi:integrase/recombinase XerD